MLKEGFYIVHYPTYEGIVFTKGGYIKGKKNGHWEYFYADGSPLKSGHYEDDIEIGEWSYNWSDGRTSKMRFENGKLVDNTFIQ